MHTGDGFMLVYSIVDDQTLEELRSIREQILRVHRDKKVPMIVVGNKADMKKDRAVSKEEGKALADEFGASFVEVSVSVYCFICNLSFVFISIDHFILFSVETNINFSFLNVRIWFQARENTKVKESFDSLVRKILQKNPKAGNDAGEGASGVFGGGKGEPDDDEAGGKGKKGKKGKKGDAGGKGDKNGKCLLL